MIQHIVTYLVDVPTIRPHKLSVATMNTQTLVLVQTEASRLDEEEKVRRRVADQQLAIDTRLDGGGRRKLLADDLGLLFHYFTAPVVMPETK